MNNEHSFSYTYSAQENQEVLNIRKKYLSKEETALDTLKALDAKVQNPVNVFAYFFGTMSAIVMGTGMSLVMTEIGEVIGLANPMVPGIAIGVIGLCMALITYPIHQKILNGRKKKYASEILTLSEKILKNPDNKNKR